jgi:hypothetical protein
MVIQSVHRLPLLLSLLVFPLAAQDSAKPFQAANLSVIVADTSGARIPSAEVAFEGARRFTTKTGLDGSAHVTLPYGSYAVTVKSRGFEAAKINDLPIGLPEPPDLKVVLQVGPSGTECDDCFGDTPIQTITSDLPNMIAPRVSLPQWSWFSNCDNKRYIGFQVLLAGKVISSSSFPICPVDDPANTAKGQQRIVAFSFRGGHVFQGAYRTNGRDKIEGNIWQAGTDPNVILFGVSFSRGKQVLLNTIHIANVESESSSEIDRGLTIRTFPADNAR